MGLAVGDSVGTEVDGEDVGDIVGLIVGAGVGDEVGDIVGATVGEAVVGGAVPSHAVGVDPEREVRRVLRAQPSSAPHAAMTRTDSAQRQRTETTHT